MNISATIVNNIAESRQEERPPADKMLLDALGQQVEQVRANRSPSTLRNYHTAIASLRAFLQSDVPLHKVDGEMMGAYERWLHGRGICHNTVSCYLRSLRALLRPLGLKDTFGRVYTGNAKTAKRSVSPEVITRIARQELPSGSFDELARDVFLFSFYAMGMPFVDVAHLRRSQISDNRIVYQRQKTGQRICVAVEPVMLDIINHHADEQSEFVFPMLSKSSDREYCTLLGRYNRALRRIGKLVGVSKPLTSYVVRHSWASTAYSANIDLPVISKALGHTNTRTTLTYIREIDDQRVADANRQIVGIVAGMTQEIAMGEKVI